jgi:cysteine-rich repeat protein
MRASNNSGTVTFDFGEAATTRGPTWRYVVGVWGLGGDNGTGVGQGPTTMTASRQLQALGHFGDLPPSAYADFDGIDTLSVQQRDNPTGFEFFVLPAEAADVVWTVTDQSFASDAFGLWVGVIDIDVSTCQSTPTFTACVANFCGDGIRGADEACDDGNNLDGDGCDASCVIETDNVCGGSVLSFCAPSGGSGASGI